MLGALRGDLSWSEAFGRRRRPIEDLVMVYKEPFTTFGTLPLAGHFPGSMFIHIIRDGRDCADSLCRTYPHALSDRILRNPLLWRQECAEIGVSRRWKEWYLPWWLPEGEEEEFAAMPQFCRHVRMWKEMVRRGRQTEKETGSERYLEVRYENMCRNPAAAADEIARFLGAQPSKRYRKRLSQVRTRSIGVHREQPTEIIAAANRIGAPLLEELGYANGGS